MHQSINSIRGLHRIIKFSDDLKLKGSSRINISIRFYFGRTHMTDIVLGTDPSKTNRDCGFRLTRSP